MKYHFYKLLPINSPNTATQKISLYGVSWGFEVQNN